MYGFFETSKKEDKQTRRNQLIEFTMTHLHSFPSTYLEMRHTLVLELLQQLDPCHPYFDTYYDRILAGIMIYALCHETEYYQDGQGSLYRFYPLSKSELFFECQIKEDRVCFKQLIPLIGKKALEDHVLPFNMDTIKTYFLYRAQSPFKPGLLKRWQDYFELIDLSYSNSSVV